MVYILFNNSEIIGLYQKESLVKQNAFVAIYKMMQQGSISQEMYFQVKQKLMSQFNMPIKDLQILLKSVNIYIDYRKIEENGFYALERVLKHIEERFNFLGLLLLFLEIQLLTTKC